jgi:hypothetical protein
VHATGGHESENSTESAEFNNGGEGVGEINAGALPKALGDETDFEAVDTAIGIRVVFKNYCCL